MEKEGEGVCRTMKNINSSGNKILNIFNQFQFTIYKHGDWVENRKWKFDGISSSNYTFAKKLFLFDASIIRFLNKKITREQDTMKRGVQRNGR